MEYNEFKPTFNPVTFDEVMNVLCSGNDNEWRIDALITYAPVMRQDDWLKAFGMWWTGIDDIGQRFENGEFQDVEHLVDVTGPVMSMMTDSEREAFAALPDEVIVYRGCYKWNKWGNSWSLSPDAAERFPFIDGFRMSGERPLLVKGRIKKDKISALKLTRKEFEIVCLHEKPKHISTRTAKPSIKKMDVVAGYFSAQETLKKAQLKMDAARVAAGMTEESQQ